MLSEHWDGTRFHNRNGSDKHLGDISRYLWRSITQEAPWPKWLENPPADPIVDRVTSGIRATYINHATVLIR